MDIWFIRLETRNFEFVAYGESEEQANEAMGRALAKHAAEYRLDPDWWSEYEFETHRVHRCGTYRNGERLV